MLAGHKARISMLAIKGDLAAVGNPLYAEAGSLIGYGVNFPAMYRRSLYFVDRILKGKKTRRSAGRATHQI